MLVAAVVLGVLLALVVTALAALDVDSSPAASAPGSASSHPPTTTASPARPTSSASPTPSAPDGFERYENLTLGYAVEYPDDWRFFERRNGRIVDFQHGWSTGLTIIATRTPFDDPVQVLNMWWKGVKATAQDVREIDRTERLTVAGFPAASVEFTGRVPQLDRFQLQMLQVVVLDGPRAYLFTYVSSPERFDGQRAEAEAIMESLQPVG